MQKEDNKRISEELIIYCCLCTCNNVSVWRRGKNLKSLLFSHRFILSLLIRYVRENLRAFVCVSGNVSLCVCLCVCVCVCVFALLLSVFLVFVASCVRLFLLKFYLFSFAHTICINYRLSEYFQYSKVKRRSNKCRPSERLLLLGLFLCHFVWSLHNMGMVDTPRFAK